MVALVSIDQIELHADFGGAVDNHLALILRQLPDRFRGPRRPEERLAKPPQVEMLAAFSFMSEVNWHAKRACIETVRELIGREGYDRPSIAALERLYDGTIGDLFVLEEMRRGSFWARWRKAGSKFATFALAVALYIGGEVFVESETGSRFIATLSERFDAGVNYLEEVMNPAAQRSPALTTTEVVGNNTCRVSLRTSH